MRLSFALRVLGFSLAVFSATGCGSSSSGAGGVDLPPPTGFARDASSDAHIVQSLGSGATLTSLTVSPAQATITSLNGATGSATFTVSAHYSNGHTAPVTSGATWTAGGANVGGIDGTGTFTASGMLGGVVQITAASGGLTASAMLTVKLHLTTNPGSVPPASQAALMAATTADPAIALSYPYDGTAWPRGLGAPTLMWTGGAATDSYYVHLTSPTFELEELTTVPPPADLAFDQPTWDTFVNSTVGAATLHVARFDGTTATVIGDQTWTIGSAAARGTIYYWANNLGRIMRLKPGAATPEDFSAGVVPSPGNGCTMACHTVSADGSTMMAVGGTFGGSYDLKTNAPRYGLGGTPDSTQIRQWALSAVTADGKYTVNNALAAQLSGISAAGMFDTTSGAAIPGATSGLGSELYYMPAFSPDGSRMVFVGDTDGMTAYWASTGSAGPLKVFDFNETATPMLTNERQVVAAGSDPNLSTIAWPSISPDGRWAIYSRMSWVDPTTQHNLTSYPPMTSDLYLADLDNPGTEIRLAALDGDGYPFVAGARDLHLNFEPTFAPVASGGYFWVVFLSRRTYGNILTGDRTTEKQLWVAAIDQNPVAGKDPSHAAFHLPGQDVTSLNLRGYWALDPCQADGTSCSSGTQCCGGYCTGAGDAGSAAGDAGSAVCSTSTSSCSADGNRCNATSDCCGAASGSTCINHVCSEATPK
jgi:hypothetical protein